MRLLDPNRYDETFQDLPHKHHWQEWVDKNSKPKVYNFLPHKTNSTRFQKPGPMTNEDWKRFDKWSNKIFPKKLKRPTKQPLPPKPTKLRHKRKIMDQRMEHLQRLAQPKHIREKYEIPPPEIYPFAPTIDPNKPATLGKCRPFQPVQLPDQWYHDELEMEFWRHMQYPVSQKALSYKISKNVKSLAEPRIYPVKPHCEIPAQEVYEPPKRVQMTKIQWKEHQKRLEILSRPIYRETLSSKVTGWTERITTLPIKTYFEVPPQEVYDPPKRVKMTKLQWKEHKKRLEILSKPIQRETLSSKVTERTKRKISRPEGCRFNNLQYHIYEDEF